MSGAILSKADFTRAFLTKTNLFAAILSPSILNAEQLEKRLELVESLKGATMPDGSIHP